MVDLERSCPTAAHWSEPQYRELFQTARNAPQRLVLVAEDNSLDMARRASTATGRIAAFLVARHVSADWELENIVVAPATRRMGIGCQMLDGLLTRARQTNSETVFLEVRESNLAARCLYVKAGFHETGRRTLYYSNPPEDAVLYRFPLR